MTIVLLDMAISLDGYVAAPGNADNGLHDWYFSPAPPSAAVIDELIQSIGAMIMGRRTYEASGEGDGDDQDPYTSARFILTHHPPESVRSYTFVNDGIESALAQAKAAAGNGVVCIAGGADTARQYLRAGLVDEVQLHVIPKIFGGGLRLFDGENTGEIQLEQTRVIESVGVTHLKYRVLK